ncbi:hypothetical protein ACR9E3_00640 [Actinomycetospora sp. C-140]
MLPVPTVRLQPWVLRTLVLTVVFGVAEALFVALRSWSPDLLRLWSIVLLLVVSVVVIGWVGAEIVLGRRPPEWTWFITALVTAPAAGLLSWILLAAFVDETGVADLQTALVGRASFVALLILAAVFVGSRLGWLSMRRHGEGTEDPFLDADDEAVARQAAIDRGDVDPLAEERAAAAARAAARAGVRPAAATAVAPSVAGVRTPGRRTPEVAERERMPEAPRLAQQRRVSTVRAAGEPSPGSSSGSSTPVSSPFGQPDVTTPRPAHPDAPEPVDPPVVAVLPSFPMPGGRLDPTGSQPVVRSEDAQPSDSEEPERGPRRKFGLRRPKS